MANSLVIISFLVLTFRGAGAAQDLAAPDPPSAANPQRRLKQLSGKSGFPRDPVTHRAHDLADPSPPQQVLQPDGSTAIRITGSGRISLEWNCGSAGKSWDCFLRGQTPLIVKQNYVTPEHRPLIDDELPWDSTIEKFSGQEYLFGGTITTEPGTDPSVPATIAEDQASRRVYQFRKDASTGDWVRLFKSVFGKEPAENRSPLGYNYGHQFIKDPATDKLWMFYDKMNFVGSMNLIQCFAREVLNLPASSDPGAPTVQLTGDEYPVISVSSGSLNQAPFYPATAFNSVTRLSEGPRPAVMKLAGQSFYVVGYSSGDFTSNYNTYSLNFAASRTLASARPYVPQLNEDGTDLEDAGAAIREKYQLTWGPGRPALFTDPQGQWWVLFHAADPNTRPRFRNIYLAPVVVSMGSDGLPKLHLADNN